MSTTSFELNPATSLSDDSGIPHTNSSISSGDSSRLIGLCKFEYELAESDGEVSQFDSLENCSDGGMSGENFNTLKKGPLAPIDPPPEFQDSPQTTLLRSPALQNFALKFTRNVITNAIQLYATTVTLEKQIIIIQNDLLIIENEKQILQEQLSPPLPLPPAAPPPSPSVTVATASGPTTTTTTTLITKSSASSPILPKKTSHPSSFPSPLPPLIIYSNDNTNLCEKHLKPFEIYASDPFVNRCHTGNDNIYDIPNNEETDYDDNDIEYDHDIESSDNICNTNDDIKYNISNKNKRKIIVDIEHQDCKSVANNYKHHNQHLHHHQQQQHHNSLINEQNKEYMLSKSSTKHLNDALISSKKDIEKLNQLKLASASDIHNYDIYYNNKKSTIIQQPNTPKHPRYTNKDHQHHFHQQQQHQSSNQDQQQKSSRNNDMFYQSTATFHQIDSLNNRRKKTSILYSPLHYPHGSNLSSINRPNSRNSLNSRLSSSHNSLTIPTTNKADDSIFITQAMSHDALNNREIADFYNVPVDSDIYALPIDVIKSSLHDLTSSTTIHTLCRISNRTVKMGNGCSGGIGVSNCIGSNGIISVSEYVDNNEDLHSNSKSNKNSRSKFKNVRNHKKRKRQQQPQQNDDITDCSKYGGGNVSGPGSCGGNRIKSTKLIDNKRHSVPENCIEPMHMSLDEVKRFYHSLYSSSSESSDTITKNINCAIHNRRNVYTLNNNSKHINNSNNNNNNNNHNNNNITIIKNDTINYNNNNLNNSNTISSVKSRNIVNFKNKKLNSIKDECANNNNNNNNNNNINNNFSDSNNNNNNINNNNNNNQKYGIAAATNGATKKSQFSINLNLKQKFCSIFRFRRSHQSSNNSNNCNNQDSTTEYVTNRHNNTNDVNGKVDKKIKFSTRALPPLPDKDASVVDEGVEENRCDKKSVDNTMDFAANIEKVKEYGWYWGPISSEVAEKILSNEPDGSFIVRDSSDDHYIFSLTFKLNNSIRHVRIEQDQGAFSFGSCAKFKSSTIMEFIENAVESSRSGRYLFFFHRRPEHGPMRVQLTNPVSRFKHIQSLQHMCRFVIRKAVIRKDLIQTLPLPRRLLDYLSYKNCYSEQVDSDSSQSEVLQIFSGCNES